MRSGLGNGCDCSLLVIVVIIVYAYDARGEQHGSLSGFVIERVIL